MRKAFAATLAALALVLGLAATSARATASPLTLGEVPFATTAGSSGAVITSVTGTTNRSSDVITFKLKNGSSRTWCSASFLRDKKSNFALYMAVGSSSSSSAKVNRKFTWPALQSLKYGNYDKGHGWSIFRAEMKNKKVQYLYNVGLRGSGKSCVVTIWHK